jgi:hypothetical protein
MSAKSWLYEVVDLNRDNAIDFDEFEPWLESFDTQQIESIGEADSAGNPPHTDSCIDKTPPPPPPPLTEGSGTEAKQLPSAHLDTATASPVALQPDLSRLRYTYAAGFLILAMVFVPVLLGIFISACRWRRGVSWPQQRLTSAVALGQHQRADPVIAPRTFATSNFKAVYETTEVPGGAMEMGSALMDLLRAHCTRHSIPWKTVGLGYVHTRPISVLNFIDMTHLVLFVSNATDSTESSKKKH